MIIGMQRVCASHKCYLGVVGVSTRRGCGAPWMVLLGRVLLAALATTAERAAAAGVLTTGRAAAAQQVGSVKIALLSAYWCAALLSFGCQRLHTCAWQCTRGARLMCVATYKSRSCLQAAALL